MAIKHKKVSEAVDSPDDSLIRPSDWNAAHKIDVDIGDYGGSFASYTPPETTEESDFRVVVDTNTNEARIYVYANGAWRYVDLTNV